MCYFLYFVDFLFFFFFFFFQAEDGIRDRDVTGVQTCALPISCKCRRKRWTRSTSSSPRSVTVTGTRAPIRSTSCSSAKRGRRRARGTARGTRMRYHAPLSVSTLIAPTSHHAQHRRRVPAGENLRLPHRLRAGAAVPHRAPGQARRAGPERHPALLRR